MKFIKCRCIRLSSIALILILIVSFSRLRSQDQLSIDTNQYIFLGITPQINGIHYQYKYKIASDTMLCIKSIFAHGSTSTSIIVDNKFKAFLGNEFILGLNNVKINLSHTSTVQSFAVSCIIFSGSMERWFSIHDQYYLTQIFPLLTTFNGLLPPKEKFSLNFNRTVIVRPSVGERIDVVIDYCQEDSHPNEKQITIDLTKNIYALRYYDTIEKKNSYRSLPFDVKTLTQLKSKTLNWVNSFSIKNKIITDTGLSSKIILIRYQFPGIYLETRVKSTEKKTHNIYKGEVIKFLNSKLDKKYKLE